MYARRPSQSAGREYAWGWVNRPNKVGHSWHSYFYSTFQISYAKFVQFCIPATTVLPLDGNQPAAPTFPVQPFPTLTRPPDLTSAIPAPALSPNCRTPNLPSFPTTPDRTAPVDLYRKMRLCLTVKTWGTVCLSGACWKSDSILMIWDFFIILGYKDIHSEAKKEGRTNALKEKKDVMIVDLRFFYYIRVRENL